MVPLARIAAAVFFTLLPGVTPGQSAAQAPTTFGPGIFAITSAGAVELTVYGERDIQVGDLVRKTFYPPGAFDKIPAGDDLRSFVVNMPGWTPRDLYMIVGRKNLQTPFEKNRRLTGRLLPRGPVFEVVSDGFDLASLQKDYVRLLPKKATDEQSEAFVVVEVGSSDGLNRRCYPVRLRLAK
jgi:hypothetical protein